jgi:uncharacterized membrane protein YuzA (DUF378 family)
MIRSNTAIKVTYAICFVLVLIGAINWLVWGSYRLHHRKDFNREPIEDLFSWIEYLFPDEVSRPVTFYTQNVLYIVVGVAAVLLLVAHLTVVKEIARQRDTRQAYVR